MTRRTQLRLFSQIDVPSTQLPPPVPLLAPWRTGHPGGCRPAIFDPYVEGADSIFVEVGLPEADVAVLPFSWKYTLHHPRLREVAIRFANEAAAAGKRVLIFFDSDSTEAVPLANAIVFRTSGSRARRAAHEHGLPGWTSDILHERLDGRLELRPKRELPAIGFAGYAPPLGVPFGTTKIKESVRWLLARTRVAEHLAVQDGYYQRVEAIRSCRRTPGVITRFSIRPRFSFTSTGDSWGTGGIDRTVFASGAYDEFVRNVLESDYVICSRGYGNYSFRLYETLSCGRIPIFVDTDCLLPFDDMADWRSVCVWIDRSDVARTGERVREFHERISGAEFEALQRSARRFWEMWIAPHAFYRRMADRLIESADHRDLELGNEGHGNTG